jgi:signal peptidase II
VLNTFKLDLTPNRRVGYLAAGVFLADQLSKLVVLQLLGRDEERQILPGFFKFVRWENTGAAFSLFRHNNDILAIISIAALFALWTFRRHFEADRIPGQIALGLLFGGIAGNLLDRILPARRHVIDFLYFHLHPRGGDEIGFPAFNLADSAICIGVGLLILLSWNEPPRRVDTAVEDAPAVEPK